MLPASAFVLGLSFLAPHGSHASAIPPVAIIIPQAAAPVEIVEYQARYQTGGTYLTQGIDHQLKYRARGAGQSVVAVKFGLIAFDIFNRFLDRTGGVDMDELVAGKVKPGEWVATAYGAFAFHTGVAFVDKVRFADGTIWTSDEAAVLAELRKIAADFDAKQLKEPTRGDAK